VRDVQSAVAQLPALRAVCFEKLAALVRRLDLAKLIRRGVGIENIEPFVVGQEKRGAAAGSRRRKRATAAPSGGRRSRQIPESEAGKSGAGADEQRFLQLAQRHRSVRRPVAEGALRHLEAETEPPRTAAVEGLNSGYLQTASKSSGVGLISILVEGDIPPSRAESILYRIGEMVQFCSLQ
jgi:hypothetical protein